MSATDSAALQAWLDSADFSAAPVIALQGKSIVLDLSAGSLALGEPLDNIDVQHFGQLIDERLQRDGAVLAYGRWGERRALYNNDNFGTSNEERRTIHMGVDVFCAAGTAVCTPLDGVVEIVANNEQELDYGPLLVVRHTAPDRQAFFTLYGHLGPDCLVDRRPGEALRAGDRIATVGAPPGNGNWPPHLHFQLILDLLDLGRNFPGVARASEQARWLALSPNPARFFPDVSAAELDGRR
jgi:murein DD-endopeptidase MepM/ murein hydrolase activator NlpD